MLRKIFVKPSKIRTEFLSLNDPALRTQTCYPWYWSCSNVRIYNQSSCFITATLFLLHFCVPFLFLSFIQQDFLLEDELYLAQIYDDCVNITLLISYAECHLKVNTTGWHDFHCTIVKSSFLSNGTFHETFNNLTFCNSGPVLNWWSSSKTVQETNDYRRPLRHGIFIRLGLKKTYLMCCFYCASSVRVSGPHLVNEQQAARIKKLGFFLLLPQNSHIWPKIAIFGSKLSFLVILGQIWRLYISCVVLLRVISLSFWASSGERATSRQACCH